MRFTPDDAAHLGGNEWLKERRVAAARRFDESTLPTQSEEEWRYSRIGDLKLEEFALERTEQKSLADRPLGKVAEQFIAAVSKRSALVRTVNGSVVTIDSVSDIESVEVAIERLTEMERLPSVFNAVLSHRSDVFADLSDAYFADALVVQIAPGVMVEDPIVIVHEVVSESTPIVVFPQVFVALGEGARADVIEIYCSDDESCLVIPTTALEIADNATLSYQAVQHLGSHAWQLGAQHSRLGREATFKSFVTALGGLYARTSIDSRLEGERSSSQLLAVYFGDDNQVQDFRTFQQHSAAHTKSELVFKGAVAGNSRSVYTGLIRIDRGAVRSDASQTNRNLVLSEGAHADSVPNLDILENDVRCTHASAVGPIDPEQRFYLETRGVPGEIADQLILLGFFNDLFDRAPSRAAVQYLKDELASRLLASSITSDVVDETVGSK